jgi:uncharacterized membrane protein YjjP (DUF1212 family)
VRAPDAVPLRSCLLLLGAAALAGGRPVHEVEQELLRIAMARGAPEARVAATPTGLFVALERSAPVAFEPTGPTLRFDQVAQVTRISDRVLSGALDPDEAIEALGAVLRAPAPTRPWVAAAGLVPIAAGVELVLQPAAANVLAATAGGAVVALLALAAGRWALLATLLPVVAAFVLGCLMFLAEGADLIDGPLRTLLAPLAVLLPGALIVTGMSELAAGAMVAGTARLVFGAVQLLLLTFGVVAAVRVSGVAPEALANVRIDELGPWAPWAGLLLVGLGSTST